MTAKSIERETALAQGRARYFTGKPCSRGHVAERNVSDRACVECSRLKAERKRRARGAPERYWPTDEEKSAKRKEYERRYRRENKDRLSENCRRWRGSNRELVRERERKRRTTPGEYRERHLEGRAKWRDANREKLRADQAARRSESPEKVRENSRRSYWKNLEKSRARVKAYREKNLERGKKARAARKYWREWRAANLEHAREYSRRYYAEKPNKTAAIHKRRARKKQAGGSHTPADLKAILSAQSHRCAYCRADLRKVKKHLDHRVPLSRGGRNDKSNLVWACMSCNLSKGARDEIEFAQQMGRLL